MKKWFVGLLMMAMALVMIPSVVMAETEVSFYCPSCCEQRTGIKSDTYEYFDQNTHRQRITCKVCNYKGMSVSSAHTETKAATCQSAAYCKFQPLSTTCTGKQLHFHGDSAPLSRA